MPLRLSASGRRLVLILALLGCGDAPEPQLAVTRAGAQTSGRAAAAQTAIDASRRTALVTAADRARDSGSATMTGRWS